MRITVLDFSARQKLSAFCQLLNHRRIHIAFFAIGFENSFAAEKWQIGPHRAIFHYVIGKHLLQHARIAIQLKLIHTMAGGTMDKSGAVLFGDKGRGAKIARLIPFAIAALHAGQGMGQAGI